MSLADDRAAIEEVLVGYAHAMDDREFDRLQHVFTADAEFGQDPPVVGVHAIVAHLRHLLRGCGESQHLLGTISIDIDGKSASARSAIRAFHRGAGERQNLVYEMFGDYHDGFRLTNQGWRISRRVLQPRIRVGPRDLVLGLDQAV